MRNQEHVKFRQEELLSQSNDQLAKVNQLQCNTVGTRKIQQGEGKIKQL